MPQPRNKITVERSELEEFRLRTRAAEERTLEYWMYAVVSNSTGSMSVRAMEQTLSWRMTRPLRAAKIVQLRVKQVGVLRTVKTVRERLAQIRQAKKRG